MKILFLDPSVKADTVRDIREKPCGGRKTSLFHLPDALGGRGHDCWVYANIARPGITPGGTKWVNNRPPEDVDVLVLNRGAMMGAPHYKARLRVLWTHDLPHNGFVEDPKVLKAIGLTVFMSRYGERVWRTFYRDIGRGVIIPNGVDRETFKPAPDEFVEPRFLFCCAPNRGLKRLPLIFDAVKSRVKVPGFCMVAFSNMGKLHPGEVEDTEQDGFDLSYKTARESGIDLRDPVPPGELAYMMARSAAVVIPSGYPEICSNTVLQALACGAPVITTGGLGATPEWVRHRENGMLTEFRPDDYMVHTVEMVRNCVEILTDSKLAAKLRRNAAKTRNVLAWGDIARAWEKAITRAM